MEAALRLGPNPSYEEFRRKFEIVRLQWESAIAEAWVAKAKEDHPDLPDHAVRRLIEELMDGSRGAMAERRGRTYQRGTA